MFEYKNETFFTSYFENLPDFKIIEDFKKSDDREEENLYVGKVEVLNTIHPLELRVEIPFAFPHMSLTFRTKSISGYPHLIHTGKTKYGDWFCLNTPFAETAEEQLNIEVSRLKEWISRQLRSDLPAHIKDLNVQRALALSDAYSWERNPEEEQEFSNKAKFTFVGNWDNSAEYFRKSKGYIHCVKTPDDRLYALQNEAITNHKLPYVIVDELPQSEDTLADFIQLRDFYNWDEEMCEHLLPGFSLHENYRRSSGQRRYRSIEVEETEALNQLESVREELGKESPYLDCRVGLFDSIMKPTYIIPVVKKILLKEIESLVEKIKKEGVFRVSLHQDCPNPRDMSEEEYEEYCQKENEMEREMERYFYSFIYFALGLKSGNDIRWVILYTNRSSGEVEYLNFDLKIKSISIDKVLSYPINYTFSQTVSEKKFFGRGAFSNSLKNKRIALVGLGAIGSMVAESLAHSGVSKLGLWDNDVVEPGNICRSAYTLRELGESKVKALKSIINSINPYVKTEYIRTNGWWYHTDVNHANYRNGSFYGNINYDNQEDAIKKLKDYDLVIDCTGSNEMLHFLSYAVPDIDVISMCITNHANELLCLTSRDGNVFEQRKAYLSRIEQDTKNFYVEGSGCYSPTFLATNADIVSLVNLSLRDINKNAENGRLMHSTIYSHTDRGVLADRIHTYELIGYDILLNIPNEALLDAEEMNLTLDGHYGYILGSYSRDGKQILVTHIIDAQNAMGVLQDTFETSHGIIDYIGDFDISGPNKNEFKQSTLEQVKSKAGDPEINTMNPLLAIKNPDGTVTFFLYINNELVLFAERN